MREKHIPEHLRMAQPTFDRLKAGTVQGRPWPGGLEVVIVDSMPENTVDHVQAHTIRAHLFIRLGGDFYWHGILYVNPYDPRLAPG